MHRRLFTSRVYFSRKALSRAELHAWRSALATEHANAARCRTWVLGERLVGWQRELGKARRVVHVAVVGMEQDVARQAARTEAGKLGVQLQALQRITRTELRIH